MSGKTASSHDRPRLRLALVALAASWLGLLAGGCVDNYGAFYISQAMLPGTDCTAPSPVVGGGTSFLGSGLLDVSLKRGYMMFPQVENHMPTTSSSSALETNLIMMREFQVRIDLGSVPVTVADSLLKFSLPSVGTMSPGNGMVFKLDGVIQDQLAEALAAKIPVNFTTTIIANLRAIGVRSGSDIESPEFPFAIKLCNGCLVDLRTTCPESTDANVYSNTCGRPQDSPVTCCPGSQPGTTICLQSNT